MLHRKLTNFEGVVNMLVFFGQGVPCRQERCPLDSARPIFDKSLKH